MRYGPRILAQYIDDGEYVVSMYVMMASVETRIWMHLDQPIIEHHIPGLYALSRKISSRRSAQFLNEPTSELLFFSFFIGFLFHDTHNTGNKENFFLNDVTQLTHFMHTQFNL